MVTAYPLAAVVLSAGGSSRMGRPKALLPLEGEPLVLHHLRALAGVADPLAIVLGAGAEAIRAVLPPRIRIVENASWQTTHPADSVRAALEALDLRCACLVTPVDVAPATRETLARLLAAGPPAVPVGPDGREGHPVLLDPERVRAIRERAPEGGLRALLVDAPRVPVADPLVAGDFDDPAAWARFVARWMQQAEGGRDSG